MTAAGEKVVANIQYKYSTVCNARVERKRFEKVGEKKNGGKMMCVAWSHNLKFSKSEISESAVARQLQRAVKNRVGNSLAAPNFGRPRFSIV